MTSPWDTLRDVDPAIADTMAAAWSLPTPLDALAVVVLWALRVVCLIGTTATLNVATLGVWWPVGYWLVIVGLWSTARAGAEVDAKVFAGGEDVAAFGAGGRASWLGTAAKVTRFRVKLKANVAAAQIVGGYGGAALLLAVGVLWTWLFVVAALVVAAWYQVNLRRRWWLE